MSIQKVGWEYINGVPALTNLINMIEVAIQGASLPIYAKSPGWDFKGFYVESNKFWCGINYSEPLVMVFRIEDRKNFNSKLVDKPNYPMAEDRYAIRFLLQFEDKHFFSLDKDEQLDEITNFVQKAYSDAQQMWIKEK